MYDVKLDFHNSLIQKHVNQLRFMPVIDDIYESNKQHHPESQHKTEKECQSKNQHELVMPEPKAHLHSDTQKILIDLTPTVSVTLQNENEPSEFTNTPLVNDPTYSIPNERPKCICRLLAYLKDDEALRERCSV